MRQNNHPLCPVLRKEEKQQFCVCVMEHNWPGNLCSGGHLNVFQDINKMVLPSYLNAYNFLWISENGKQVVILSRHQIKPLIGDMVVTCYLILYRFAFCFIWTVLQHHISMQELIRNKLSVNWSCLEGISHVFIGIILK